MMKDLKARHDSLRKIAVVLMCMCLILVGTMFVACDSQEDLTPYRKTKIGEIQSYAAAKIQCEYSESNVAAINEIVENGKRSVNKSKSRTDIDSTVINTRQALDMIEPLRSEEIRDGVYFMTDIGYEWYHKRYGDWPAKEWLYVIIINGQMISSHKSTYVYTVSENNGIYLGTTWNEYWKPFYSMSVWQTDGVLYARRNSAGWNYETCQYRLDTTIDITDIETKQLSALSSTDMEIDEDLYSYYIYIRWKYELKYGNFGILIEIKNDEFNDYTPVNTHRRSGPFSLSAGFHTFKYDKIDEISYYLKQGEHYVRVSNMGGYLLNKERKIVQYIQSDYVYFKITVTSDGTPAGQILD